MKGLALVVVPASAVWGLVASYRGESAWAVLTGLVKAWWLLPLLTSVVCVTVLIACAILGDPRRIGRPSRISTGAYIVVGPSLAGLNLLSFIPSAPTVPTWAEPLLVALLFIAALVYYIGLGGEEESPSTNATREPAFSF